MDTERIRHIKTLEFIIGQTHVEPFRSALIAGKNSLTRECAREESEIRSPEDWPYCAKCGKAYVSQPTHDCYAHAVVPACNCSPAETTWFGRPDASVAWDCVLAREIPARKIKSFWGDYKCLISGAEEPI